LRAESARKADLFFAPPAAARASIFVMRSFGRVTVAFSLLPKYADTSISTYAQIAPALDPTSGFRPGMTVVD
jgi:hypothetical protein